MEDSSYMNETIYLNSSLIFKKLIPNKASSFKKDEIAQRKWIISSHFDNGLKLRNLLYQKIFKGNNLIPKFEKSKVLLNFFYLNAYLLTILDYFYL